MVQKKINISDALFSKVRQRVLGLLYNNPDSDFHTNEIIRISNSGTGAVQRELESLTAAGLVKVTQVGNQRRYQANRDTLFFVELRSIVLKTFGLADVLRETLAPIAKQISVAFIYGSIAKQEDTAQSDIDLMIIGENLTYGDIYKLLEKSEAQLGRKINPTFYSSAEWFRKNKEGNNFVTKTLQRPKIFLIGTENELGNLDNLVKTGKLKKEAFEVNEFLGLIKSGKIRLNDANNTILAPESRFDLAYNAAHSLALAALRWHGYRSDNRYIVFQVLPHTLGIAPEVWRILDKCHNLRNVAEYEGHLDITEQILSDLLTTTQTLLDEVEKLQAQTTKPD